MFFFSWLNVGVRLNGSCVKGNVLNKFLTIIPLYLGQLLVDYVRLRFLRDFWFLHWHYVIWGRDRKCHCGWPENEAPKCWYQPDFCMCGGGERREEMKSVLAHTRRMFSGKDNIFCGLFSWTVVQWLQLIQHVFLQSNEKWSEKAL